VSFEGSGMLGDKDYTGDMLLSKKDVGYVKLTYDSFRKYFDPKGGYYPLGATSIATVNENLKMDIGDLGLEIGNKTPEDSTFSVFYDRKTKNGEKDHLTWATLKDNVTGNGKYIAPSWAELNETTDTLGVRGKAQVLGFNVKGEQQYQFFEGNTLRHEDWLRPGAAANSSDRKYRTMADDMQTKSLITKVLADRWTVNDKTYLSMGYSYAHLRNTDIQTIREYQSNGTPWLFSRGKYDNGHALNTEDKNTWTGQLLSEVLPSLTFSTKLKAGATTYKGSSEYDFITTGSGTNNAVPGSGPDSSYAVRTETSELLTGEGFSLKYNGISRTSLFADLSLAQDSRDLSRQRVLSGAATSADFSRDVTNRAPELEGTVGFRVTPVKTVSITTDYTHSKRKDKVDPEELIGDNADSLINYFRSDADAFSSRVSWKPVKWLENSFRAKMGGTVYHTSADFETIRKTNVNERSFVYDVVVMPAEQWMFDLSATLQQFNTNTLVSDLGITPVYTANVYSWMVSTSYAPTEKFTIFNTLGYSKAYNKHDYQQTDINGAAIATVLNRGLAMGANDEWYDAEFGVNMELKKDLTVAPHYAYYGYRANDSVETGNYSAHIVWVDVGMKF
jgi:hypothetical protein